MFSTLLHFEVVLALGVLNETGVLGEVNGSSLRTSSFEQLLLEISLVDLSLVVEDRVSQPAQILVVIA